jgi:hypothetical protein
MGTIEGLVDGESGLDMDIRSDDRQIHLLRVAANNLYRPVTSQLDWPTYNGQVNGNRFSKATEIAPDNVGKLVPKWVFTMPNVARLETTPVVVEGILYATSGNESYALDAGNGRGLWHFQRPRTRGLVAMRPAASITASRWLGTASSWLPIMHICWPSIGLRAHSSGKRKWRTGARTTMPQAYRSLLVIS